MGRNVVLTGTVDLYADKEEADNRVHHVKGVKGVENEIQVAGPTVEDATLRDKLAKELAYRHAWDTERRRSPPSPSACTTAW